MQAGKCADAVHPPVILAEQMCDILPKSAAGGGSVKRPNSALFFALIISISASVPMHAGIINFDDIDASLGDVPLDGLSPYQGLTWANLTAYTSVPGFPGYNNGIVSQPNAAYTAGDALGSPIISSVTRASGFDFTSAYLGSGWYDGLTVTLNGVSNGVQDFTQTVTVNTEAPQLFTFDFTDITELDIYSTVTASTTDPYGCGASGCSQVTLDDLSVTLLNNPPPPGVPEPGTFPLLCLALFALVASPRLRRSFRRS
jgi:hypothetical protein